MNVRTPKNHTSFYLTRASVFLALSADLRLLIDTKVESTGERQPRRRGLALEGQDPGLGGPGPSAENRVRALLAGPFRGRLVLFHISEFWFPHL